MYCEHGFGDDEDFEEWARSVEECLMCEATREQCVVKRMLLEWKKAQPEKEGEES